MAFVIADRVQETTATAGTGNFTLAGASLGYRTFASQMAVGDTTRYTAVDSITGAWESGTGFLNTTTTLGRLPEASSNGGAAVSFAGNATTVVFISASAGFLKGVRAPQVVPIGYRMRGLPGASFGTANDTTNSFMLSQESYMTPLESGVRNIRLGYTAYDQVGSGMVHRRNTATISAAIYCPSLVSGTVTVSTQAASGATSLAVTGHGSNSIRVGDRLTGTGIAANCYVTAVAMAFAAAGSEFVTTATLTITPATTAIVTVNTVITVLGGIYQATMNTTGTTMALAPGRQIAFFDPLPIYIPANTQFYVRTHVAFSSAAIFSAEHPLNTGSVNLTGEACQRGTTTLLTSLLIPTTPTQVGAGFWPPAIITAQPDNAMPSVLVIGDSQTQGWSDGGDASGRIGFIAKSLTNKIPWMHFGRPANTIWGESRELAPYVDAANDCNTTHVIIGLGTNDVGTQAQTGANTVTRVRALAKPFLEQHMKVWVLTLFPSTTATGGGFTADPATGQAVANAGQNTQRNAYNNDLRTNWPTYGFDRLVDLDALCRDTTSTDKWKAGYTTDGLHPGPNAVTAIVAAGYFAPTQFAL